MFIHLGTMGTGGLFIPQIIKSLKITVSQLSPMIMITSLTGFVFSLLVSKLGGKITAKNMILIGSMAGTLHFYLNSMAQKTLLLYLGGFFAGITFGFGTQTCNAVIISQWFKKKYLVVTGIVISGAAFGSAVMMFISGILIDSVGWRYTYQLFAALHLFIAIPVNLLLIKENKTKRYKFDYANITDTEKTLNTDPKGETLTMKDIRRSSSYRILILSMVLCGTLVIGFKTFAPSYWQENGMSALVSSKYIGIFMVMATLSIAVSGTIAEKYGNKFFIEYLHVTYVIGMLSMLLSPIGFKFRSIITPIFFVAISYPLYGSIPSTITIETFGENNYKKVSGELMAAFYLGLAIVSPLIGILRDITGTYKAGFFVITVFGVASCLMMKIAIRLSPVKNVKQ